MAAKSGDRVVMLGKVKKASPKDRAGVIERVLSEDPPRYEIRWDSGSLTVVAPLPGAIRIEPKRTRPRPAAAAAKKAAAKKPAAKKPAARKASK